MIKKAVDLFFTFCFLSFVPFVFIVVLTGCPPTPPHAKPIAEEYPVQPTQSGVVWEILHDANGKNIYRTKTTDGWLIHYSWNNQLLYVPDRHREWLTVKRVQAELDDPPQDY